MGFLQSDEIRDNLNFIGRKSEISRLEAALDSAIESHGSMILLAGEAGIGKTRLVSELENNPKCSSFKVLKGWCLAESLEPLMPFSEMLRTAGLAHLISKVSTPRVLSVYLMNEAGILLAKAERGDTDLDSEIFASMLSAVGTFMRDSLSKMTHSREGSLNSIGYGQYKIMLSKRGTLSLSLVLEGTENEFLIDDMKQLLIKLDGKLDGWRGDTSESEFVIPKLAWFIDSGKYNGSNILDKPRLKQENLFDNVLIGLQRFSSEWPLIIFVDDLQWCDPTSLRLLHYIARNTRENRVLILGAYRPEDLVRARDGKPNPLEAAMQNMGREGLFHRIELERFNENETGNLITFTLGPNGFDENFLHGIHKQTGGTPFFIIEVLKVLADEGAIVRDGSGRWIVAKDPGSLALPTKIVDVVQRRLDRITGDQRDLLGLASVIGEEFSADLLERISEVKKIPLLKHLGEIERTHRLIHAMKSKYRFDHAKVREVLYQEISDELRSEYHRQVGDILVGLQEAGEMDRIEEIAHHYSRARDQRAGQYLVLAGDKAAQAFVNQDAIQSYENALDFLRPDEQPVIFEKIADIYTIEGDYENAIRYYSREMESSAEAETRARSLRKTGTVLDKRGEFEEALQTLAIARDSLGGVKCLEMGRIMLAEGSVQWKKGNYDKAMPLFHDAINLFKELDSQADLGEALRALSPIYIARGDFNSALQFAEQSLKMMKLANDQLAVANSHNIIGIVHHSRGELDKALQNYKESLAIREKIGDKLGISASLNNIGVVYSDKCELDESIQCYERSLAIRRKLGDKQGIATSLSNIANVYTAKCDIVKALEFHKQGLAILESIGDKSGIATSLTNIGDIYHRLGNLDSALEHTMNGLRMHEALGNQQAIALSLHNMGNIHVDLGELDKALEFHSRSLAIREKLGQLSGVSESLRDLGEAHRLRHEWLEALERYKRGLDIEKDLGSRHGLAFFNIGMAETYLGLGNLAEALSCARESIEISSELNSTSGEAAGRRILGAIHRAKGEWDSAASELDRALNLVLSASDRDQTGLVYFEIGMLRKAMGEDTKAAASFLKAAECFEALGKSFWASRCRKETGTG